MASKADTPRWMMHGITADGVEEYLYSMLPPRDPVLAEMELNELVWTELRPEMTRVGAFLGSAAAKQPELSDPIDDLKRP